MHVKYSVFFNHLRVLPLKPGVFLCRLIMVIYFADSPCQQFQDDVVDDVVVGCGVVLNSASSVLYEYFENVQLVLSM